MYLHVTSFVQPMGA